MGKTAIPRLLLPHIVRDVVVPGKPGTYVLGNDKNGFVPGYIGRSETCLQTRLATHNKLYEFDYFLFRYAENTVDAFFQECEFWHACQELVMSNRIHPAAPHGSCLECPFCHFARNVGLMLA